MSDTASVASDTGSKRGYTMSVHAAQQRALNAEKKRWFTNMRDLSDKLSLKVNEAKLVEEISSSLLKVFTFSDIVGMYKTEYDEMVENEVMARSGQLTGPAPITHVNESMGGIIAGLQQETKQQSKYINELEYRMSMCRSCWKYPRVDSQ